MTDTLVKAENVSKKFCRDLKKSLWYGMKDLCSELIGRQRGSTDDLRPDEFWAVKDVSFELKRGECLGLIGRNGAGKTTLLRMLNGLIKPDSGHIEMRGRVGALIALGAGFNPILTGRENIYVNAAVLGLSKKETTAQIDAIIDFSELKEFIDSPVQHYSSGMYVRLGFSIAAHLKPDILLVDEALAVGDLAFIVKCLNRIARLRRAGTCVIFVSHNELQVREAAQACFLLNRGRGTLFSKANEAFGVYNRLNNNCKSVDNPDVGFVYGGPVQINYLSFYGPTPTDLARTGDNISIMLECKTEGRYDNADLELRFWNAAGQLISTIQSSIADKLYCLPKGRALFRIKINSNALAPGPYRLAGGIRRNGEVLGWSRDLAHIEIMPPIRKTPSTGLLVQNVEILGPLAE